MAIESTDTIEGLVTTNPVTSDPVYQGPSHFWLIKRVLKLIFPGVAGNGFAKPITATEDDLIAVKGIYGTPTTTNGKVTTLESFIANARVAGAGIEQRVAALEAAGSTPGAPMWQIPIGGIYMSIFEDDPAITLGYGQWVRGAGGKVLVGQIVGDPVFGTPQTQGGSYSVTLPPHNHTTTTVASSSHTHTVRFGQAIDVGTAGGASRFAMGAINDGSQGIISEAGGAHSHAVNVDIAGTSVVNANMPPYIVVVIWRRVA